MRGVVTIIAAEGTNIGVIGTCLCLATPARRPPQLRLVKAVRR